MVCDRCKTAVGSILLRLGIKPVSLELGVVVVEGSLSSETRANLVNSLNEQGFELLEDRQQQIIDRIKSSIIELVHYKNSRLDVNLSVYLADKMRADYSALSKLFSEYTGITIEKYLILQKTERVKELIFYNELSLSEIAAIMNYSSVAYLSAQFKQVTGMTPTQFKAMKNKGLQSLDSLG